MRPIVFKCSSLLLGLLFAGAGMTLALIPLIPALGWTPGLQWILGGIASFMLVYALTLIPTRLVLSDEGLLQKLLLSELRLKWEDMEEWRYLMSTEGDYLWIRDCNGRKHQPKRWLVFGKRLEQFAVILEQRGIRGEIRDLRR